MIPRRPATALEAAEVLGIDPARVFKTLMVEVEGRLAVGDRSRQPETWI